MNPSEITVLLVKLYSWKHGFTTSGGSVWINNYSQPTAISTHQAYVPEEGTKEAMLTNNVLYTSFSWPKTGPYQDEKSISPEVMGITIKHYEDFTNVSKEQLAPN